VGVQSVQTVDQRELVHFLESQPAVLAPATTATLVARLSRPETWGTPARTAVEADPTPAFLDLDTRTGEAAFAVASRPRPIASGRRPRPTAPLRVPAPGPAARLLHATVALLAALVVLPMGVAVVVTALGASVSGLIRR
jgi:hypothetical protein